MEKQDIIMDATVLSTLMGCPRAADNRFNKLIVPAGGKSNSLECGSLAHVILEYFNKALIRGKSRSDAIDEGFAGGMEYIKGCSACRMNECKIHKDNDFIGLANTPEDSSDRNIIGWSWVIKTMQEYFDFYKNDSYIVIAAEEVKGRIIYEDDDIRVLWKAKFDEIMDTENGLLSRDHKTAKQRKTTLDMSNQFMGQCTLLNTRRVQINKIGWQKSLKSEEKFERVTLSYSADRLTEWAFDVVPYYARMLLAYTKAGVFPPNFTHCENKFGWCDYVKICQDDRNLRGLEYQLDFVKGKEWDVRND